MGCRGRAAWRCWPALAGQMTVEACHGRAQEGKQGREREDREKERERERFEAYFETNFFQNSVWKLEKF